MVLLAKACVERNNTTAEKELLLLRHMANKKTQGRSIKQMLKQLGQNSMTKLYSTRDGIGTECMEKACRKVACILENISCFSQAKISELGYLADMDAAERILDGNYEIPKDLDPYAAMPIYEELCMPDSICNHPFVTSRVTTKDHAQGWEKQKEPISANPTQQAVL
jgi:hypothetical protein